MATLGHDHLMAPGEVAKSLGVLAWRVQNLLALGKLPCVVVGGRRFINFEGFAVAAKELGLDGMAVRCTLDAVCRWEEPPGAALCMQHEGVKLLMGTATGGLSEAEARKRWQKANPTAAARAALELSGFDLAHVIGELREVFGS